MMGLAQVAKISKALADPMRLSVYQKIASRKEMYCGELADCGLTPGTISHHLKTLAEAGLIESRREGQFIYNRALPETLRKYTAAVQGLARKS